MLTNLTRTVATAAVVQYTNAPDGPHDVHTNWGEIVLYRNGKTERAGAGLRRLQDLVWGWGVWADGQRPAWERWQ